MIRVDKESYLGLIKILHNSDNIKMTVAEAKDLALEWLGTRTEGNDKVELIIAIRKTTGCLLESARVIVDKWMDYEPSYNLVENQLASAEREASGHPTA